MGKLVTRFYIDENGELDFTNQGESWYISSVGLSGWYSDQYGYNEHFYQDSNGVYGFDS